jgi:hypothetical protein
VCGLVADFAQRPVVRAFAPVSGCDFLATRTFVVVVVDVPLAASLRTGGVIRLYTSHGEPPSSIALEQAYVDTELLSGGVYDWRTWSEGISVIWRTLVDDCVFAMPAGFKWVEMVGHVV